MTATPAKVFILCVCVFFQEITSSIDVTRCVCICMSMHVCYMFSARCGLSPSSCSACLLCPYTILSMSTSMAFDSPSLSLHEAPPHHPRIPVFVTLSSLPFWSCNWLTTGRDPQEAIPLAPLEVLIKRRAIAAVPRTDRTAIEGGYEPRWLSRELSPGAEACVLPVMGLFRSEGWKWNPWAAERRMPVDSYLPGGRPHGEKRPGGLSREPGREDGP